MPVTCDILEKRQIRREQETLAGQASIIGWWQGCANISDPTYDQTSVSGRLRSQPRYKVEHHGIRIR